MTRATRRCASALALGVLMAAAPGVGAAFGTPTPQATSKAATQGVVNVNTATLAELELLPGVGPVRARAIIDHRKAHGPFDDLDDLAGVKGIGDKALERLRPHVVLRGKTTASGGG